MFPELELMQDYLKKLREGHLKDGFFGYFLDPVYPMSDSPAIEKPDSVKGLAFGENTDLVQLAYSLRSAINQIYVDITQEWNSVSNEMASSSDETKKKHHDAWSVYTRAVELVASLNYRLTALAAVNGLDMKAVCPSLSDELKICEKELVKLNASYADYRRRIQDRAAVMSANIDRVFIHNRNTTPVIYESSYYDILDCFRTVIPSSLMSEDHSVYDYSGRPKSLSDSILSNVEIRYLEREDYREVSIPKSVDGLSHVYDSYLPTVFMLDGRNRNELQFGVMNDRCRSHALHDHKLFARITLKGSVDYTLLFSSETDSLFYSVNDHKGTFPVWNLLGPNDRLPFHIQELRNALKSSLEK